MSHVPALRAALQDAAERRHRRARRRFRGGLAVACVAAGSWLAFIAAPRDRPASEVVASPTPSYTTKVTPVPERREPRILEARLIQDGPGETRLLPDAGVGAGRIERSWATTGMPGPIFLVRSDDGNWCLSVPDPAGLGSRGVACAPDDLFVDVGVSITVGDSYAAVIGLGKPAPTYRGLDGARKPLTVAAGGLVALTRVPAGTSVTLHGADGSRRTDVFHYRPRFRYHCANGRVIDLVEDLRGRRDPCAQPPSPGGTFRIG